MSPIPQSLRPRSLRALLILALVLSGSACQPPTDEQGSRLARAKPGELWPLYLEDADVESEALVIRKLVYVPVYSSIYWSEKGTNELTATMSVRNVSPEHEIYLLSVNYYNSAGELVRTYFDTPHRLNPLATADFVIPFRNTEGGTGANFLVDWGSREAGPDPLFETVMVGQVGNAGVSLSSRGVVVQESTNAPE